MRQFADIRQQLLWSNLSENAEPDNMGETKVKEVCQAFLKFKGIHGIEATKRKPIPKQWTDDAYMRQKGVCDRCGIAMDYHTTDPDMIVTGDHKVPLEKGGRHTKRNIVAMHKKCNSAKGSNDYYTESKKLGKTMIEQMKNLMTDEPEKPQQ